MIQIGQQKKFTISVTVGAIVNVILNYTLINLMGTIGAVISSVIAELSVLTVQLLYIRKEINILEIGKVAIKYLISSLAMFAVVASLASKMPISIKNTGIQVLVGVIIYIVALILLKDKFVKDGINQFTIGIKNKVRKVKKS